MEFEDVVPPALPVARSLAINVFLEFSYVLGPPCSDASNTVLEAGPLAYSPPDVRLISREHEVYQVASRVEAASGASEL